MPIELQYAYTLFTLINNYFICTWGTSTMIEAGFAPYPILLGIYNTLNPAAALVAQLLIIVFFILLGARIISRNKFKAKPALYSIVAFLTVYATICFGFWLYLAAPISQTKTMQLTAAKDTLSLIKAASALSQTPTPVSEKKLTEWIDRYHSLKSAKVITRQQFYDLAESYNALKLDAPAVDNWLKTYNPNLASTPAAVLSLDSNAALDAD